MPLRSGSSRAPGTENVGRGTGSEGRGGCRSAPSSTRWRSRARGSSSWRTPPAVSLPAGSDAALLADGFATVTVPRATAELHIAELDDLLAE